MTVVHLLSPLGAPKLMTLNAFGLFGAFNSGVPRYDGFLIVCASYAACACACVNPIEAKYCSTDAIQRGNTRGGRLFHVWRNKTSANPNAINPYAKVVGSAPTPRDHSVHAEGTVSTYSVVHTGVTTPVVGFSTVKGRGAGPFVVTVEVATGVTVVVPDPGLTTAMGPATGAGGLGRGPVLAETIAAWLAFWTNVGRLAGNAATNASYCASVRNDANKLGSRTASFGSDSGRDIGE